MFSLHPVTTSDVVEFLSACAAGTSERGAAGLEMLTRGDSRGPAAAGVALAEFLAARQPSFVLTEISFTNWEATIDRGLGMLLRPPARLLVDAGLDREIAKQFPIRLDHNGGMMAGAYVPAHLIDQLHTLLESRLERQLRRLTEAELDPVANMGLMLQAVEYAHQHGTGLIEAADVVDGLGRSFRAVVADRKQLPKSLRARLEATARPPRKPGLMGRLFGANEAAKLADAEMQAFLATDVTRSDPDAE